MNNPRCPCHNEPMLWQADKRKKSGGYWRCVVRLREAKNRYGHSLKGRQRNTLYKQSEKGKATQARFNASPKGQARNERYRHSPAYRRKQMRLVVRNRTRRMDQIEKELSHP